MVHYSAHPSIAPNFAAGAFWLYAAISGVGLLWTWWFLPETNGLTLDQIQGLFAQKGAKSRESDGAESEMLA